MFNPNNPKEIVFPHFIPTAKFGDKVYTWNDCNGGAKLVTEMGFVKHQCMGGRCDKMGFVKDLGLWACLDKFDKKMVKVFAFYMYDPDEVTDKGKQFITEVFPKHDIVYVKYKSLDDIPKTKIVDTAKLEKLKAEALKLDVNPDALSGASIETVESFIKAKKFEIAEEKKAAKAESAAAEPKKPKTPIRRTATA
jgi:hypothetical protein